MADESIKLIRAEMKSKHNNGYPQIHIEQLETIKSKYIPRNQKQEKMTVFWTHTAWQK